jgi:CRP/FNR family transcriptional regulator, cyclic AMP receptor protein
MNNNVSWDAELRLENTKEKGEMSRQSITTGICYEYHGDGRIFCGLARLFDVLHENHGPASGGWHAYLGSLHPVLVLHLILLPLNCIRLREMLRLTREVRVVTQGDLNMDWLKPFTSVRPYGCGDVLFRKGDIADAMYFVVSGRFRLTELSKDILPGQIVGELGLLAPDRLRTQTLRCIEGGQMLQITYEQVKELYYQNPQFGFYFLQLTARRLFENISSLERDLGAFRTAKHINPV